MSATDKPTYAEVVANAAASTPTAARGNPTPTPTATTTVAAAATPTTTAAATVPAISTPTAAGGNPTPTPTVTTTVAAATNQTTTAAAVPAVKPAGHGPPMPSAKGDQSLAATSTVAAATVVTPSAGQGGATANNSQTAETGHGPPMPPAKGDQPPAGTSSEKLTGGLPNVSAGIKGTNESKTGNRFQPLQQKIPPRTSGSAKKDVASIQGDANVVASEVQAKNQLSKMNERANAPKLVAHRVAGLKEDSKPPALPQDHLSRLLNDSSHKTVQELSREKRHAVPNNGIMDFLKEHIMPKLADLRTDLDGKPSLEALNDIINPVLDDTTEIRSGIKALPKAVLFMLHELQEQKQYTDKEFLDAFAGSCSLYDALKKSVDENCERAEDGSLRFKSVEVDSAGNIGYKENNSSVKAPSEGDWPWELPFVVLRKINDLSFDKVSLTAAQDGFQNLQELSLGAIKKRLCEFEGQTQSEPDEGEERTPPMMADNTIQLSLTKLQQRVEKLESSVAVQAEVFDDKDDNGDHAPFTRADFDKYVQDVLPGIVAVAVTAANGKKGERAAAAKEKEETTTQNKLDDMESRLSEMEKRETTVTRKNNMMATADKAWIKAKIKHHGFSAKDVGLALEAETPQNTTTPKKRKHQLPTQSQNKKARTAPKTKATSSST